jgi:hypothetical protein
MRKKESYVVRAALVMAVAVVMVIPVMGIAGSLEPSAAPASTMKTLDQIPPTWSIKIPGAERFVVLTDFNNEAVFDKESGLVWEKSPWTTKYQWEAAINICVQKQTGGRYGWHLPTVEQLSSLMDISVSGEPKLPVGHPFSVVQPYSYWSATTFVGDTSTAYIVDFSNGFNISSPFKMSLVYIWCVRGGQSYDSY